MSASTDRKARNRFASDYAEEQEYSSTDERAELEDAFRAGWDKSATQRALGSSKLLADLLEFCKSWAETTTEEECHSPSVKALVFAVDENCIKKARSILQKHKIKFEHPQGET